MQYVDALLASSYYRNAIQTIEANEITRRFCRHGLTHALDVARMSWIYCLENQRPFNKSTVYLAALLHDIGRANDNANHDAESVRLAQLMLEEINVPEAIISEVCEAISAHRVKKASIDLTSAPLGEILAWADKRSRLCFHCNATDDCYWEAKHKNASVLT